MNPQNPPQTAQGQNQPDGDQLKTDIVSNIPIHTAGGPAAPVKEDENLDKIMQDVGHELKKEDTKPAKHHLFSKKHEPQNPKPSQPAHNPLHSAPVQNHQAQANPKQAKPKPEHNAPVMVIIVTVIVTGILIAGTVAVYLQSN